MLIYQACDKRLPKLDGKWSDARGLILQYW